MVRKLGVHLRRGNILTARTIMSARRSRPCPSAASPPRASACAEGNSGAASGHFSTARQTNNAPHSSPQGVSPPVYDDAWRCTNSLEPGLQLLNATLGTCTGPGSPVGAVAVQQRVAAPGPPSVKPRYRPT